MSRIDLRFSLSLAGAVAAGLVAGYLAAPERQDLFFSAAAGAVFAALIGIAGNEVVRRASAGSMEKGVQAFLAVMTGKMLAFAAFLLIVAFSTPLNIPALAFGLVGTTVVGEILVIDALRRPGGGVSPGADSPEQGRNVSAGQAGMPASKTKEGGSS